jgi:hypothetical protein
MSGATATGIMTPSGEQPLSRGPHPVAIPSAISVLALVAVFAGCLVYVYISWLSPIYYYLGFPLAPGDHPVLGLSVAIVLLTAALMRREITRFSDFLLWMVFFFVYTPALLFIPLQGLLDDDGLVTVCCLGLSFNLMMLAGTFSVRLPVLRISELHLAVAFFVTYAALNAWVLATYGGSLSLADFNNVYDQRFRASDITSGTLVGYGVALLSGAYNPFLIAIGLAERRLVCFIVGALGQVFMYSAFAMKSVVLSIVLMPFFFFLLLRQRRIKATRLALLIAGSCLVPLCLIPILAPGGEGLLWIVTSLIFMRTYGLAGALTGVYADFFSNHPLTYFSHVNLIAMFVPYPYEQSVGEVVGFSMVGDKLDANANFWASDGITSLGSPGIIVMGLLVGGFLLALNSMVRARDLRLTCTAFIPFIIGLCNTSLFTTLFSGGGGLLTVMIYLWQFRRPLQHSTTTCQQRR